MATYESVKEGRDLKNIKEVSVNIFFNLWVHNRRSKIATNLEELYRDSTYAYFGKKLAGFSQPTVHLYKVNADSLAIMLPNYSELDGYRLMTHLWNEIVSKEEKELWINSKCPKGKNRPDYTYALIDKKVVLTMNWQIRNCTELQMLRNKQYSLTYNLMSKRIEE